MSYQANTTELETTGKVFQSINLKYGASNGLRRIFSKATVTNATVHAPFEFLAKCHFSDKT